MKTYLLALWSCITLVASHAPGQSVTTAIVGSQMTVGATGPGGAVQSATQPAGPLFAFGPLLITPFGGMSAINWTTNGDSSIGTTVVLSHTLLSSGGAQFFANGSFTLEYTASLPVNASLKILGGCGGDSGVTIPAVSVDIDADGTIDIGSVLQDDLGFSYTLPFAAGQTRRVTVAMSSSLPATLTNVTANVTITIAPDTTYLSVTKNVIGCEPSPVHFAGNASFADTGIDWSLAAFSAPILGVIGLSMQPVLLGSYGTNPCVLVPSPDILFFAPTGVQHLALPQSVRPLTFYVQGVVLGIGTLWPTDGYAVQAL